jgi:hypothetical protein
MCTLRFLLAEMKTPAVRTGRTATVSCTGNLPSSTLYTFSSTFNPYELGIVDTIVRTLLPTLCYGKYTRAVRAELHKLDVSTPTLLSPPFPCL